MVSSQQDSFLLKDELKAPKVLHLSVNHSRFITRVTGGEESSIPSSNQSRAWAVCGIPLSHHSLGICGK